MTFRVVLLGIGHTNAFVLRQWAMAPPADAQLTCIAPHPVSTYSGMLPGVLAGQYKPSDMEIPLAPWCTAARATWLQDDVVGLDARQRVVYLRTTGPIEFDALVVGIGSQPRRDGVHFSDDAPLLSLKPMQTLLARLADQVANWPTTPRTTTRHVVIVGSGAGGIELAFCLPVWFKSHLPEVRIATTLVGGSTHVLPAARSWTRRRVATELAKREIQVRTGQRVVRIESRAVVFADGSHVDADLVVWATDAVAPPLLGQFHLPTDERGFLLTRDTLQSVASDHLFAVGDAGTLVNHRLPKAGVYAVREGPIVWENLQRLRDQRPLVEYRPQRDFLQLFNLGDGRAIGQYRALTFTGRWVWRWKDRIDRRFMQQYQAPPLTASR